MATKTRKELIDSTMELGRKLNQMAEEKNVPGIDLKVLEETLNGFKKKAFIAEHCNKVLDAYNKLKLVKTQKS